MAKLMVMIDIPNTSHDELVKELKDKAFDWWDDGDSGMIIVDEAYLKRANCDDSFFAFELIGVKP